MYSGVRYRILVSDSWLSVQLSVTGVWSIWRWSSLSSSDLSQLICLFGDEPHKTLIRFRTDLVTYQRLQSTSCKFWYCENVTVFWRCKCIECFKWNGWFVWTVAWLWVRLRLKPDLLVSAVISSFQLHYVALIIYWTSSSSHRAWQAACIAWQACVIHSLSLLSVPACCVSEILSILFVCIIDICCFWCTLCSFLFYVVTVCMRVKCCSTVWVQKITPYGLRFSDIFFTNTWEF